MAAQGQAVPPPELVLAWQCERWGALPEVGGVYDQDAVLMQRMASLANVYQVVARVRGLAGAQIHSLTPGERRILGPLVEAGLV